METNEIINNTLDRVGIGKIKLNQSIIDEALSFNVNELDIIDDTDITKFIVALSQYLVYITIEVNKLKIKKTILDRGIEVDIATFIASTGLKKGTKAERKFLAISTSPELREKNEKFQIVLTELMLLDNIDKYLEFYVNALKHELSRREHELNFKVRLTDE